MQDKQVNCYIGKLFTASGIRLSNNLNTLDANSFHFPDNNSLDFNI